MAGVFASLCLLLELHRLDILLDIGSVNKGKYVCQSLPVHSPNPLDILLRALGHGSKGKLLCPVCGKAFLQRELLTLDKRSAEG